MSTYSIEVSGPSAKLAMLRALAHKLLGQLHTIAMTVKIMLTRTARVAKAATTTGLALVGSRAGYQLARHGVRSLVTGAVHVAGTGLRLISRGLKAVGRVLLSGLATISPTAADVVEHVVHEWVLQPISQVVITVSGWVRDVAEAVWDLSDSGLVKTVTVRAAQAASLVLAVHTVTKGAAAAKLVSVLPWAMDAVVVLTNPARIALLVVTAFAAALVVAALRVLDSEGPDDEPQEADTVEAVPTETTEPPRPQLRPVPDVPEVDLPAVAAKLNVEVAPDGSVLVHGIPNELPAEVGLEVARVAAQAATSRLERILLHRSVPNRDDRRLLTKVAREAVRNQATVLAG